MPTDNLKWYCETSREHEHSTEWEAAGCTDLYNLWQAADAIVRSYVGEEIVEDMVNAVLPEDSEDDAT